MSVADTMIHVDENLDAIDQAKIVENIRGIPGVISPKFNPGHEHMLMVAFDPNGTSSVNLLENVKRLGYHAELIGL